MEKGRKKIHYAWFILAGCCIMQGASLGLINNCSGVFYSPVCQDLGFEMGKFTFYRMLYSISSAVVCGRYDPGDRVLIFVHDRGPHPFK